MSTKGSGEFRRISMLDLAVVWEADRGFKLLIARAAASSSVRAIGGRGCAYHDLVPSLSFTLWLSCNTGETGLIPCVTVACRCRCLVEEHVAHVGVVRVLKLPLNVLMTQFEERAT
jgi:hypothetical protein